MSEDIEVRALLVEPVKRPIAERLCEDLLEWVDDQGWGLQAPSGDERSYEDMAKQFVEGYK